MGDREYSPSEPRLGSRSSIGESAGRNLGLPLPELHELDDDAASSGETIVDLRCLGNLLFRKDRRSLSLATGMSAVYWDG